MSPDKIDIKPTATFIGKTFIAADHVLLTCCKHTRGLAGKDRPFNIYADESFYSFLTQRGVVISTRALWHLCSDVIITAVHFCRAVSRGQGSAHRA